MSSSTFTWLAYNDVEREQFAALVRALDEPETLDNIGIGVVRDAIANVLFPGTSTIQTRARYFILVARAAIAVEQTNPRTTTDFARGLLRIERRTLDALRPRGQFGIGIIGWGSGWGTKRWPSSVYWNGLAEWGIRRGTGSLHSYASSVVAQSRGRAQRLSDEPEQPSTASVWWDELPSWEGSDSFPGSDLEVMPTAREAEYLLHRMASTFAGGRQRPPSLATQPSLLSVLAQNLAIAQVAAPWDVPTADPLLCRVLAHAELFSLTMHGAQLRYNRLAMDRAHELGSELDETDLEMRETTWLTETHERLSDVREWQQEFNDFVALIRGIGGRLKPGTRAFYQRWVEAVARDPFEAYRDETLADVIRDRERQLKGRNARLTKTEALMRWDGALFGAARLDYRWSVASRHLNDCSAALGGARASGR